MRRAMFVGLFLLSAVGVYAANVVFDDQLAVGTLSAIVGDAVRGKTSLTQNTGTVTPFSSTAAAGVVVTQPAVGVHGLSVNGISAGTADLIEINDSGAVDMFNVNPATRTATAGRTFRVYNGSVTPLSASAAGGVDITVVSASANGLDVIGSNAQTASIVRFARNSTYRAQVSEEAAFVDCYCTGTTWAGCGITLTEPGETCWFHDSDDEVDYEIKYVDQAGAAGVRASLRTFTTTP